MAELTVRIEPGDIVERVLDEKLYKGKTLREWADYIANPKTNADRIRAMTDEELAEWFGGSEAFCPPGQHETNECDACPDVCTGHWLSWLKSPVEVEE